MKTNENNEIFLDILEEVKQLYNSVNDESKEDLLRQFKAFVSHTKPRLLLRTYTIPSEYLKMKKKLQSI